MFKKILSENGWPIEDPYFKPELDKYLKDLKTIIYSNYDYGQKYQLKKHSSFGSNKADDRLVGKGERRPYLYLR